MEEYVLHERIKELAAEKELSIYDVNEQANLSVNTISKWKQPSNPSVFLVARVADVLDTSVDYLIGRTDNPTPIDEAVKDERFRSLQRAGLINDPAYQKLYNNVLTELSDFVEAKLDDKR